METSWSWWLPLQLTLAQRRQAVCRHSCWLNDFCRLTGWVTELSSRRPDPFNFFSWKRRGKSSVVNARLLSVQVLLIKTLDLCACRILFMRPASVGRGIVYWQPLSVPLSISCLSRTEGHRKLNLARMKPMNTGGPWPRIFRNCL